MSNRTKTQIEREERKYRNTAPYIAGLTMDKPYFSKYFHANPSKCMPRKSNEEKALADASEAPEQLSTYTAICSMSEVCGVKKCKHAEPHEHDSSCTKHRPFNPGHTGAASTADNLMEKGIKIDRCGVCKVANEVAKAKKTTAADYIKAEMQVPAIDVVKDLEELKEKGE